MSSWRAYFGVVGLIVGVDCARPQAKPWPQRIHQALLEHTQPLPEAARAEYEAGFANGATMVHEALKAGVRPYKPVLGIQAPGPRWLGPVPEGVTVETAKVSPEVDLASGLLLHPTGGENASFARGQVDGFSWALGAIGQTLVRPIQNLQMPSRWLSWKDHVAGEDLDQGTWSVRLLWTPGQLSWSRKERGFPSQRTWRAWDDPEPPSWVGLSEGVLWLETTRRQAIAMDIQSGGILAVRPAVLHPPSPSMESYDQETLREFQSPEFQQRLEALRKTAASGRVEDLLAVVEHLQGMGKEADLEAYDWSLKAAETGSSKAMLRVGVALFHGQPVPADRGAARRWMERAIQAGEPNAAAVLKMLFDDGKGAPPPEVEKQVAESP